MILGHGEPRRVVISPEDPRNQAPAARAGRPPPGPVGSPHGLGPSSPFQAPSQWSGHLALRTVWADPQTPYRVTGFLSAMVPQAGAGAGAPLLACWGSQINRCACPLRWGAG